MKIGKLELGDKPLFLAPMEDVTDPSFRVFCKEQGVDMMYTEFVSADALVRNVNRSLRKLELMDAERPVGIQIYGNDIEKMVVAAKMAEAANPDVIDLNFGCPVKKIAGKGSGSGLLLDIPKMLAITDAVVKAVNIPVTAKTRLGWDSESLVIEQVAEQLQDVGVKALCIHGRTKEQMYNGIADWTLIGKVKENPRINIPIIGNGDVDSPQKAKQFFDDYNVDGLMIGRASIGRPWIFKEIKHFLDTGELLPPLTIKEQAQLMDEIVQKSCAMIGERRGILHARRHLAIPFKNLPDIRPLRIQLLREKTVAGISEVLMQIGDKYADYSEADSA
ncbi:tRNA dihydrouridine synthase DusB [Carboxylicivirga sediminis]|uniref:tRNA-dihydrouridine synthase n=1 Tax=Carboxylicivirga sediminis TaxID=2006564 RepID=A0A941F441_9BACT|nr:tRNA dihydrouridine synthase DusB [Carboxylicivirga sediminis]MBR8535598.1 tRNA dihydrouridine synthase DusB [Carboxylicivirga sediminis]